ncbi:hypothetical protein BYT27DRAFT_7230986, partial [Phlegmacium glaucopus]
MSSQDIIHEWKLVPIGRGSFATVSILLGRPVAFKHVIHATRTPELKTEFETLCALYSHGFCNADSFFAIPRPLAYYNPEPPSSFVSPYGSPISKQQSWAPRPFVNEDDFKALKLDTAAYAMDQVLPLPLSTALNIRTLFYPPGASGAAIPSLCRLYFGKTLDGHPSRFFNSSNFPLDVSRYRHLLDAASEGNNYPTLDEIAIGMGEMLGRMHWLAGYDGRDIEFVMGGGSFSGIAMNVIDFNQMRIWSREKDKIHQLIEAFFTNDPYYPRPRPNDQLYQMFCIGYIEAHPKDVKGAVELAEAFLHGIEAEQAKRDSPKA